MRGSISTDDPFHAEKVIGWRFLRKKGDRLLQDFPGAWGKEEVVPPGAKEPVVEVPPIPDLLGAPMPLDKKPVLRKKHGR
jgi:hypothetical protein